jgi:hypothetical protein
MRSCGADRARGGDGVLPASVLSLSSPRRPRVAGLSEIVMGKYVFAWLLGVPFALLALIYVLAHI